MKNIFIFISFISFALSLETTTTFKIDGMMCGVSCPKAVKKSLNNIEGINNCEVDFNSKTTTITYENEKIDKQQIAAIISEKTYFKITEKNEKSFWNWLFGKK
ncbi:MAG: heavy metal-associated domain-containing protein [Candidatus Neomarinimicrobiota bacterium]|nr:heavy metal-associated domain-containing protein [Candidatus Neomarinimicrobiota bacterium]|tara:strand:- start:239 stop:547 length:309 start_codon:yes stop_codon:yes gene_type:complete